MFTNAMERVKMYGNVTVSVEIGSNNLRNASTECIEVPNNDGVVPEIIHSESLAISDSYHLLSSTSHTLVFFDHSTF